MLTLNVLVTGPDGLLYEQAVKVPDTGAEGTQVPDALAVALALTSEDDPADAYDFAGILADQ